VLIIEDNLIGTIEEVNPDGRITKVKVGDKIINVIDKTVKILTWVYRVLSFLKNFKII
jgi:hypothetical protein